LPRRPEKGIGNLNKILPKNSSKYFSVLYKLKAETTACIRKIVQKPPLLINPHSKNRGFPMFSGGLINTMNKVFNMAHILNKN
jgi:competence transcription factor ComK